MPIIPVNSTKPSLILPNNAYQYIEYCQQTQLAMTQIVISSELLH